MRLCDEPAVLLAFVTKKGGAATSAQTRTLIGYRNSKRCNVTVQRSARPREAGHEA
jgi:hypothetical protein